MFNFFELDKKFALSARRLGRRQRVTLSRRSRKLRIMINDSRQDSIPLEKVAVVLQDEIKKAIGAHGMWKVRMKNAINTGKSEFTIEQVSVDNQCEFGRWLYGSTISAAEKTADYETCRKLHAEFHKVTAGVLRQALAGDKDAAAKALAPDGKFTDASARLTTAMMKWGNTAR